MANQTNNTIKHYELVPVTKDDKEYFRQLNELSYKDVVKRQFGKWDEKFQAEAFEKKWLEQSFKKIIIEGRMVGGIWVQEVDDYLQLRDIEIHPDYRNQGLGTKLLLAEIKRANQLQKKLRLQVLFQNPAYELYKRLGFEVTDNTDVHYQMEYRA